MVDQLIVVPETLVDALTAEIRGAVVSATVIVGLVARRDIVSSANSRTLYVPGATGTMNVTTALTRPVAGATRELFKYFQSEYDESAPFAAIKASQSCALPGPMALSHAAPPSVGMRNAVDHGRTGFLVDGHDPVWFAGYVDELLANAALATELGRTAAERARSYTWSTTAGRLRRLYADLATRTPVVC